MEPKILTYAKGYVVVLLKGYSPERFLNILSSHSIHIWDLNHTENGYEFTISLEDFRRLKPIVRKTKTRLLIRNRYGFPFFLQKYRKRKLFFAGILTAFLLLHSLSLFIWDIHIEGNYTYTENNLLDFLKEENVIHGMKKSQVDCDAIEKLIRNRYDDVTWVSASVSGTRLMIRMQENFDNNMVVESMGPADIVADSDCIITSIITRSGTPMVKKGDVAAKGDILVSGQIEILDDFGTVMAHEYTQADADIYGQVVYDYEDSIPLSYEKKVYTGNEKKAYGMRAFSWHLFLSAPRVSYENYDIIREQTQLVLGTNFYLPFYMEKCYYKEYLYEPVKLGKEEAEKVLKKNINDFFENFIEKGVQIVGNNVKIHIDKKTGSASGKILIIQAIGKPAPLAGEIEPPEADADREDGS